MFTADGPGVVRNGDKVVAVKGKVRGQDGWMAMRNVGSENHALVVTALSTLRAGVSSEDLARELNRLEGKG